LLDLREIVQKRKPAAKPLEIQTAQANGKGNRKGSAPKRVNNRKSK
jgi:hypothetical protein